MAHQVDAYLDELQERALAAEQQLLLGIMIYDFDRDQSVFVFEAAREPGYVEHLPFVWHEDPKETRWHPAEPSPIIALMNKRRSKE